MVPYDTEEEQIEALKKWWQDNWSTIVSGVFIGIASIGGWQWWEGNQAAKAEQLSFQYHQMSTVLGTGETEALRMRGETLLEASGTGVYADLAALGIARAQQDLNDPEAARAQLKRVMEDGSNDALQALARTRLARQLLDAGDLDNAMQLITDASGGVFEDLRGDILFARGDVDGARMAYTRAIATLDTSAPIRPVVQMKLDDLGQSNLLKEP